MHADRPRAPVDLPEAATLRLNRTRFLSFAALVALGVGGIALIDPTTLLGSKGIHGNAAANVWMREMGVVLVAIGVIAWCVRAHPDSPTLRAVLWGNALLQGLLLPVEILAYAQGTITVLSGVVPNSILHGLLGIGFCVFARAMARSALTTPTGST